MLNDDRIRVLIAHNNPLVAAGLEAAFSTRRVAKEAKLGLGSVQHVFPTTDSLLTAMFEDLVTSYDVAYQERMAKLPFNGEARLSAALDYLLNDICNPETRHMFFGFWALSCHNRLVETLMQQAYTHHQNNVATFIGAVRADLTDDDGSWNQAPTV